MARKKSTAPAPESAGFRGFGAQALPFLTALRENNDRDWFAANKSIFLEELDGPFRELIGEVGVRNGQPGIEAGADRAEPGLSDLSRCPVLERQEPVQDQPRRGASSRRGQVAARPGLHPRRAGQFVCCRRVFISRKADRLKALRMAILEDAKVFTKLLGKLEAGGIALSMGETLSRMPKSFEDSADSPVAPHLKLKSFVVTRPIADEDLESRELPEQIVKFAVAATPFLEFFWSRID